jgi:hypothetical protein
LAITVACLYYFVVPTPAECSVAEVYCLQEFFNVVIVIFLKFTMTIYMTTLNTYTGEVYPTTVRVYGYGICMTFG